MAECDDQSNLIERVVFKLAEPQNQARLLQVAWKISLFMMVLGFILIIKTVYPNFMVWS
jgi:hypothetical protein